MINHPTTQDNPLSQFADHRHGRYYDDDHLEESPCSAPPSPVSGGRNIISSSTNDIVLQESFEPVAPGTPPPRYIYYTAIADSTDRNLFPVHNTRVTCCHCDNTQDLFEEWNPHTGEHRAVCNTCTWAFCLRCHIEPAMNIIVFQGGKATLPKLSSNGCRYMFVWLCSTCGRDEAVCENRVRQRSSFATVDIKTFRCDHCMQNATRGCIFLAMSVYEEDLLAGAHSVSTTRDESLGEKRRTFDMSPVQGSGTWTNIFKRLRKTK